MVSVDGVRGVGSALGLVLSACSASSSGEQGMGEAWVVDLEAKGDVGAFLSVFGEQPEDVRAVGGQMQALGDAGVGAVRRFDGTTWHAESLPPSTPFLNWVHGENGTLFAVGNAGAALRHDDTGWTAIPTGLDVPLWGVFAIADDDVWTVGGDPFDTAGSPALAHFDGQAWTTLDLPDLDRPAAALFKVWATGPADVWAVGDAGVILHFDGSTWAQAPSGTGNDLISLWGSGPDDIVAVGGRDVGTIARYDGKSWHAQVVGELPGLNGVWVDPEGDATIVGNLGAVAGLAAGTFAPEPQSSGAGQMVLHGTFGFADGPHFAVGGSLDSSPPYLGIIVRRGSG